MKSIRLGIVGLGAAGQAFIPPLLKNPGFTWAAFTEPSASVREKQMALHGIAGHATFGEMLEQANLDAVYIATPTELHAQQVCQAAASGKHILVEKPMATSLHDAHAMAEAAERAGVVMVVGHSHGHDMPIRAMREVVQSGVMGKVFMAHSWCYTDWVNRPRRPEEFDVSKGGGVTFRQGAHQFDILRAICGGNAASVRARTFNSDPQRDTIGAHTVFIDFDNGAVATAVYNGYGGLSSMDLCGNISEWGFLQPAHSRTYYQRQAGHGSVEQEIAAKRERAATAIPPEAPFQPFFGLTIVSCEKGDIRQSPKGLFLYGADGVQELLLPVDRSPRDLVLEEFYEAVTGKSPALHDGRSGIANLEICVAAIESSLTGKSVDLREHFAK